MGQEQEDKLNGATFAMRGLKVFVGVTLAVLSLELLTRLVLPPGNWTPGQGLSSAAYRLSKGDLLLTKPDLDTFTCVNLSPWTKLVTDKCGFRVPESGAPQRGETAERIVVLGASNTWGMGVLAEETWPSLLADLLTEAGKDVSVMNGAQVGYTLPHMFRRARQIVDEIEVDRILIAVPSSGLYMFGLGSSASPWSFVNFHPWQVSTLPLQFPFEELPALEEANGFVLRRDRSWRGTWIDDLRTRSALAHRIWVKTMSRFKKFDVVKKPKTVDLSLEKGRAAQLGREFCALEDLMARRKIPLHVVFFPAQWGDLVLANDDIQNQILKAFQDVARVGLRRFPRADLTADPKYHVELDARPGRDLLFDGRHLSQSGHQLVATAVARWYIDKNLGKNK